MNKNQLLEYAMFYGASPETFDKAKQLRKNMTEAEKELWSKIRMDKLNGFQFRRQHPLNIFIADFYCARLKLVIEVDGGIHQMEKQAEYDMGRDSFMQDKGITVLRFTNEEVMTNIDNVLKQISVTANSLLTFSPNLGENKKRG